MDIIQLVLQFGGIGVGVYALYVLKTLVGNHIAHNSEALDRLSDTLSKLHQLIEDKIK